MGSKAIDEWTSSHGFSRSYFYLLKKRGKAPRTMKVGACVRITDDANNEWEREREAESARAEVAWLTSGKPTGR
jgi:hypothetical protein